jgi:hypothetical protein
MGMEYEYGSEGPGHPLKARVQATDEIAGLGYRAGKDGMKLLTKTAAATWGSAGGRRSDLDHVVAASHLQFRSFGGKEVDVRGWPALPAQEQADWITNMSDHGLLYFEVQKVP